MTRGFRATSAVRKARLDPYRLSHRWPHSTFYPNVENFPVILGGVEFIKARIVLRVFGRDLLSIREPECSDGPIRVSAEFYNAKGKKCLVIEDNECAWSPRSWDIEAKGPVFTIRTARGTVGGLGCGRLATVKPLSQ